MLISAIITRINTLKQNRYATATKLDWINHVDGAVWNEVYKHTGFSDVSRVNGQAAYSLPAGVTYELVAKVYVDGEEIFPITYEDYETTGYYRDSTGKVAIYPIPTASDITPGLRIVYRLPFTQHAAITEAVYVLTPYDKVYDDYCFAMMDKYNQENEKYQNSMAFYNASFKEYVNWYKDQQGDKK
jgi:hypothetical protein